MAHEVLPSTDLSLLPGVVAEGLRAQAATVRSNETHATEEATTWRVLDTLQQQVFDEHEQQVVEPHRLAWGEACNFLREMPFTRATVEETYSGVWLRLGWDFLHPQLYRTDDSAGVPLVARFTVAAYRNTTSEAVRTLFRNIIGQKEDAGSLAVRQAVKAVGVDVPLLPVKPARPSWERAFTAAYLAEASEAQGAVWTCGSDGRPLNCVPGTAATLYKKRLERADVIAWDVWSKNPNYGHYRVTFNEDTKETLLQTVGKQHNIKNAALDDLTPVMITDFMRDNVRYDEGYGLHWSTHNAKTMQGVLELARQSAPMQPAGEHAR